jgi:hypothetical protein
MDNRDSVRTGDVLLFSGNTPTGFLLRTFVSSPWNHSGIAVRFKEIPDTTSSTGIRREISLTEDGILYVLETNTGARVDDIYGDMVVGAGFSRAEWIFPKYNKISVRRLHNTFLTDEFAQRTIEFSTKFRGHKFPESSIPFLSVWLGIHLSDKEDSKSHMFCSELMAHYYNYCIGPMYQRITGISIDYDITRLFGSGAPNSEDMYTPGHYSLEVTPNASIFVDREDIIYIAYADLLYVILQPLLLILGVMLILWMILPLPRIKSYQVMA